MAVGCSGGPRIPLTQEFWNAATAQELQAELERGVNFDTTDEQGLTPLHAAAAWSRDPATIPFLLEHGGNLLEHGGNLEARYGAGWSPLHSAAAENTETQVIAALLDAGAELEDWTSEASPPYT